MLILIFIYYPLQGCIDELIAWLRHTADILFVIGYCVIAFLKLCFLGILRYEIKEMIQKIKLLQTEMAQSILNAELGEQQLQQVRQIALRSNPFTNRFLILWLFISFSLYPSSIFLLSRIAFTITNRFYGKYQNRLRLTNIWTSPDTNQWRHTSGADSKGWKSRSWNDANRIRRKWTRIVAASPWSDTTIYQAQATLCVHEWASERSESRLGR